MVDFLAWIADWIATGVVFLVTFFVCLLLLQFVVFFSFKTATYGILSGHKAFEKEEEDEQRKRPS